MTTRSCSPPVVRDFPVDTPSLEWIVFTLNQWLLWTVASSECMSLHRHSEGQGKSICEVWGIKASLRHVLFLFEEDFVLEIIRVSRAYQLCHKVSFVRDASTLQ